jgi:hypothetical protein
MSKTKIELEEELRELKDDFCAALAELDDIKTKAKAEVLAQRDKLREESLAEDARRQLELSEARSEFDYMLEKAKTIYHNIVSQEPGNLGLAARTARDGQLHILKEIFGEL